MPTSYSLGGETKKTLNGIQETAVVSRQDPHVTSAKKGSLKPELKRELELFERYLQNFSASSF